MTHTFIMINQCNISFRSISVNLCQSIMNLELNDDAPPSPVATEVLQEAARREKLQGDLQLSTDNDSSDDDNDGKDGKETSTDDSDTDSDNNDNNDNSDNNDNNDNNDDSDKLVIDEGDDL